VAVDIVELISKDYELGGSGNWLRAIEHDSLVVDVEHNRFFWNSRGFGGGPYTWLTKIKGMSSAEAKRYIGNDTGSDLVFASTNYTVPTNNNSSDDVGNMGVSPELVDIFWEHGKRDRSYWREYRALTDATIDRFKLGRSTDNHWWTIPIFVDGKFANFQCRKQEPKMVRPWYYGLGALPFNFGILAVTDWVVLTEGPPDAIICRQYGIPAVSQTGGAGTFKPAWLNKFNTINKIYIVYNDDVAGDKGAIKIAENFGYKAKIYNFWNVGKKGFDITDYFKEGGTKKEFINLLEKDSKYYFQVQTGEEDVKRKDTLEAISEIPRLSM
jgi:DNA primase